MTNDAFTAFWVGMLAGMVLGIALAGIFAAIANAIERKGENDRRGNY